MIVGCWSSPARPLRCTALLARLTSHSLASPPQPNLSPTHTTPQPSRALIHAPSTPRHVLPPLAIAAAAAGAAAAAAARSPHPKTPAKAQAQASQRQPAPTTDGPPLLMDGILSSHAAIQYLLYVSSAPGPVLGRPQQPAPSRARLSTRALAAMRAIQPGLQRPLRLPGAEWSTAQGFFARPSSRNPIPMPERYCCLPAMMMIYALPSLPAQCHFFHTSYQKTAATAVVAATTYLHTASSTPSLLRTKPTPFAPLLKRRNQKDVQSSLRPAPLPADPVRVIRRLFTLPSPSTARRLRIVIQRSGPPGHSKIITTISTPPVWPACVQPGTPRPLSVNPPDVCFVFRQAVQARGLAEHPPADPASLTAEDPDAPCRAATASPGAFPRLFLLSRTQPALVQYRCRSPSG
ncbi:hypothetical protein IWZ01DRAFT_352889 [Phyllosticta capitalensis]